MRTAFYFKHIELGAKIVDFSGWEMPLSYRGITSEHLAVREKVGLFDVSHMGRISISGNDAESLLDFLSTNRITEKTVGTATYTVWANVAGGSVDDLLIYREAPKRFFVVVNAANRAKDLAHLRQYAVGKEVEIQDHYEGESILALQGPAAEKILSHRFPKVKELAHSHFFQQGPLIISATGYTGSPGYELYGPDAAMLDFWDWVVAQGIDPAGLGARDTLRLEMGYALYGHEIDDAIAPTESVCRWAVKWDKGDFLGRPALLEREKIRRYPIALVMEEGGVAREHYPVFQNNKKIGRVTSGTFSPSLKKAIALALVDIPLRAGDRVAVQVRKNHCKAKVVSLPFASIGLVK